MKVGLIGLGKMGFNLGQNLLEHAHELVAYDVNPAAVQELAERGASGAASLTELTGRLDSPRVLWIMVPHTFVDSVIAELTPLLSKGDIIIEAGNSHYKESIRRHEELGAHGIHFLDAGTSGGMEGARNGACYMVGGDEEAWAVVEPLFRDTAVENGYLYAGKSGSGHFLKMVHNGIEYGMMAAIGEGFEVLEKSGYDFDFEQVARVWNNGSVVRSWLMELIERAFQGCQAGGHQGSHAFLRGGTLDTGDGLRPPGSDSGYRHGSAHALPVAGDRHLHRQSRRRLA